MNKYKKIILHTFSQSYPLNAGADLGFVYFNKKTVDAYLRRLRWFRKKQAEDRGFVKAIFKNDICKFFRWDPKMLAEKKAVDGLLLEKALVVGWVEVGYLFTLPKDLIVQQSSGSMILTDTHLEFIGIFENNQIGVSTYPLTHAQMKDWFGGV